MISEIQQIFKFELKMKSSCICSPEKVQKKKDCNLNSIIIDLENFKTFFSTNNNSKEPEQWIWKFNNFMNKITNKILFYFSWSKTMPFILTCSGFQSLATFQSISSLGKRKIEKYEKIFVKVKAAVSLQNPIQ